MCWTGADVTCCLTAVFWNACIAHCLYRKIVRGDSEALLHRRLKFYVIGSAATPAIVSSLLLGGAFKPACLLIHLLTAAHPP
jgi:hypothetical protein